MLSSLGVIHDLLRIFISFSAEKRGVGTFTRKTEPITKYFSNIFVTLFPWNAKVN